MLSDAGHARNPEPGGENQNEGEEGPELEDVSEEVIKTRKARKITTPTTAEIEEHELMGHVQYRSWCKCCVAARGVGQQHRDVQPEEIADPVISSDYAYMSQKEDEVLPMLIARDRKTKAYAATMVDEKGNSTYTTSYWVGWLRSLGHRRVVMKSDNEPALLTLKQFFFNQPSRGRANS